MVAKITSAKFEQWLERGEIEQLAEHWANPNLQYIRQELLNTKVNGPEGATYWKKNRVFEWKNIGMAGST